MGWRLRRSKRFGPLRLTLSRRGVSTSVGWGPIRFGRGADGKYRRTLRPPGTGLYRVDTLGPPARDWQHMSQEDIERIRAELPPPDTLRPA